MRWMHRLVIELIFSVWCAPRRCRFHTQHQWPRVIRTAFRVLVGKPAAISYFVVVCHAGGLEWTHRVIEEPADVTVALGERRRFEATCGLGENRGTCRRWQDMLAAEVVAALRRCWRCHRNPPLLSRSSSSPRPCPRTDLVSMRLDPASSKSMSCVATPRHGRVAWDPIAAAGREPWSMLIEVTEGEAVVGRSRWWRGERARDRVPPHGARRRWFCRPLWGGSSWQQRGGKRGRWEPITAAERELVIGTIAGAGRAHHHRRGPSQAAAPRFTPAMTTRKGVEAEARFNRWRGERARARQRRRKGRGGEAEKSAEFFDGDSEGRGSRGGWGEWRWEADSRTFKIIGYIFPFFFL